MTSQLASQLQQLQQRPVGEKRLTQSFLFDSTEARSFSREQIHQLAVHGLQTLIAIDNRLHPFLDELFHPHKTRTERKLLSTEENHTLDITIERFLTLLSPHMFLTAAHQVFEYLVRVHEVHVYNVTAVLRTFLPYHDHSLFVRAVMLLDLRDTGFSFLSKNQEYGAPLLREHLVLACAESRKALRLVCLTLAMSVRMKVHNNAANALFTGVAVQLASHPDAETIWRVLLPFLVEFLSGAASGAEKGELLQQQQQDSQFLEDTHGGDTQVQLPSREVVCSALVVLAAWSNEVQLTVPTLATVMKPAIALLTRSSSYTTFNAASSTNPSSFNASATVSTNDLLGVIDLLFYTQRSVVTQVTFGPQIQMLLALPWKKWSPWIAATAEEETTSADAGMYNSLISVLLRHCLQRLRVAHSLDSVAPDVMGFVQCAVENLPLSDSLVTEVIQTLMTCHARFTIANPHDKDNKDDSNSNKKKNKKSKNSSNEEEEEEEEGTLERRGSDGNTLNKNNENEKGSSLTTWMRALERRFAHIFDATLSQLLNDVSTQSTAAAFVAQHLSGTRYELLEVCGTSGKVERLPLFSCLLHPLPEVRLLAAKELQTMTVQQLMTSSSKPHGSSTAGNSMLDLLEHVMQYEQSSKVGKQFLQTSVSAMEKLLLLTRGEEDKEIDNDKVSSSIDQQIILSHLRSMLRSLWMMITQQDDNLQKEFLHVVLQPLLLYVEKHILNSSVNKKNKKKKQSSLNTGNDMDSSYSEVQGLLLYYLTLLYLDSTDRQTKNQQDQSTLDEESNKKRYDQLRELITELEQQLLSVVPDMNRTNTFFNPALGGEEEENNASDDDTESSDDEEAAIHGNKNKKVKRGSTLRSTSEDKKTGKGESTEGYLSIFESIPLLLLLRGEASARLNLTLAQLASNSSGEFLSRESRVVMLECCLACAARLSIATVSEMDGVIRLLLRFFLGETNNNNTNTNTNSNSVFEAGYLGSLQESQRASLHGTAVKVGRGAKNSLAAPYVPQDELTATVGWTVRRGVEMRLTSSSHHNDNNNNNDEDWTGLVRVGQLLGLLSTPLPAVSVNPARLSPVYLRLLERCYDVEENGNESSTPAVITATTAAADVVGDNKEDNKINANKKDNKNVYDSIDGVEGRFPVDWFNLVFTAVFRTVDKNNNSSKKKNETTVETQMFSLSALTLTLLTPLAAPTSRRERVLQELQSIILTAASKGDRASSSINSTTVSVAQKVIEFAIQKERISATTLNAIVEAMAREESRGNITQSAAELLCRMMANNNINTKNEPAMPFFVSCRVLEYFFPIRSSNNNNNKNNRKNKAASCHISINILLPILKDILVTGGSGGKHTGTSVSCAASNFLNAVCLRTELQNTLDDNQKEENEKEENAVLQLCLELLRYPFLRVTGSRVRPVYRHALRAFAVALSHGLEGEQTNSVVFIPNKNNNNSSTRASSGESKSALFIAHITESLSHVMFNDNTCLNRLGADAAQFLLGTLGGYHRLFLPWLTRLLKEDQPDISIVADVVEVLANPSMIETSTTTKTTGITTGTTSVDAWEPPSWCALHSPMTFTDVQTLLELCGKVFENPQTGKNNNNKNKNKKKNSNQQDDKEHQSQALWPRNANALSALRLLCSLVALSPSIRIDDDDESESLFALINGLLESFPLTALLPLLTESDTNDDNMDNNNILPFHRWGMMYVRGVVDLCISSPHALNEGQLHGASRIARVLVKQTVMLMAALLIPNDDDNNNNSSEKNNNSNNSEETSESTFSRHRIDTIAGLLRIVSPLFTPTVPGSVSASAAATAAPSFAALHIPVVALLIRLESIDFSFMQNRYENAMDVCSSLLASFDIHTQLSCLAQMMQLLIDPHQQLSAPAAQNVKEEEEEDDNIVRLFRKLVKPNQVINRQETILHLVNMTVKSEAFLGGFLELQHHSHTSRTSQSKQGEVNDNENEADEHAGSTEVEKGAKTDDACMSLLVSSLELFAHYAELNASTVNDTPTTTTTMITNKKGEKEELPEFGENKAFVMLLELLAGNTLACVLAGINEPTFVSCLQRLLTDIRIPLQRKGLEVLLDRLHHALPTVEHTLTDAELEQHRQELRDPKRKLTLMDLVRVKARPLATKRSFALFTHLSALLHALFKTTTTTTTTATTESSSTVNTAIEMLPLTVSCMEELVRIVSSGGSLQAEKTLLNVHRSNRVTEAMLSKLFGNKARVQEVHRWVEDILKLLPRLLHCDAMSVKTGGTNTTGSSSSSSSVQEGILITAAGLLTALGTISQVMGTAFTTPHSNDILQVVASSAVFAVSGIPAIISRSEVGSLLRQASLSCLLRVFPSCWLMCQPHLPRIIFAATHLNNVDDTETNYRSEETMAMLEAVLEPQLFIEACTECLRGVSTSVVTSTDAKKIMRIRVETHSFALFYNSVKRRVQGLKREELQHLHILVSGTTPQDNFWLASFQALATAPSLPSRDIVQPVLEAYTVFFLKFKSKHCTRYLSTVAEWAFGGDAESLLKSVQKQQQQQLQEEDDDDDNDDDNDDESDNDINTNNKKGKNGVHEMHKRNDALSVTRTTLHCWLLFYALCNHLLEKLASILDFGFPVILPYVVSTLTAYCSSTQHTMKHAASLIARTLEGALDVIRRIAVSQTPASNHDYSIPMENYLATPTVFTAVMPALVRQLGNVVYLADGTHDYNFRVDHFVIPAIRALFHSLAPAIGSAPAQQQQQQQQSKTQQELMRALRHTSRFVRAAALRCLDGIYADGGDELAARLMAEMLPAAVEATEDREAAVVEEARRLCLNLSAITGQDVLYAMSA